MKRTLAFLALGTSLLAQAPALKPDTVIALIDGRKLTYGELESYLDALGPEKKAAALARPKELVEQYAFQEKMVQLAEKDKLDQMSPYKEALAVSRRALLTEAEFNHKSLHFVVTAEEQKKAYEEHHDRYTEVKLQVIYLGFTSDEVAKENPKKYRNEAQTSTLATKIRSDVKNPADWVRFVKMYSEDETSKANNGEYGTVKMSDNVPGEVKQAVFALKAGEISPPVRQQNGFYLFRAESVGLRPYDEVKDDIFTELKDQRMKQWIADMQKSLSVKLENEQFFLPSTSTKPQ